jgi:hypothetical protein
MCDVLQSSLDGGSQLPGDVDCVKPENAELENALKIYVEKVNKLKKEASSQKK